MRHCVAGKKLNRTSSHRKAMRRNMAASLFEHGAIRTTEAKAKDVKPFVERLITIARKGTLHARREVISILGDRNIADADGAIQEKTVITKLFDDIAPRYADRPGGYTRIIRLSERRIGDSGIQVLLQLIDESQTDAGESGAAASRRKKRASMRRQAAASVQEKPASVIVSQPEETADEAGEAEAGEAPAGEEGTDSQQEKSQ